MLSIIIIIITFNGPEISICGIILTIFLNTSKSNSIQCIMHEDKFQNFSYLISNIVSEKKYIKKE